MKSNGNNEVGNSFGIRGTIDFVVKDRETGEIQQHVTVDNHITEPFARWLMYGNLGVPDYMGTVRYEGNAQNPSPADMTKWNSSNAIARLFGIEANRTEKSQVVSCAARRSDGNQPSFKLYLLSQSIDDVMSGHVQIPPYLRTNLKGHNTTRERVTEGDFDKELECVVVYGGTNDDGGHLRINRKECRWNALLENPSFTMLYMDEKNKTSPFNNTGGVAYVIKSVVVGADSDGFVDNPSYIMIRQSLGGSVHDDIDHVWHGGEYTANANNPPLYVPRYLLCPFLRNKIGSTYHDGIITNSSDISDTAYLLSFYDFGDMGNDNFNKVANNSDLVLSEIATDNDRTAQMATDPIAIDADVAGGVVVGNVGNKIRTIRIGGMEYIEDSSDNITGCTITINWQNGLDTEPFDTGSYEINLTGLSNPQYPEKVHQYPEKDNGSFYPIEKCLPVIVPRRWEPHDDYIYYYDPQDGTGLCHRDIDGRVIETTPLHSSSVIKWSDTELRNGYFVTKDGNKPVRLVNDGTTNRVLEIIDDENSLRYKGGKDGEDVIEIFATVGVSKGKSFTVNGITHNTVGFNIYRITIPISVFLQNEMPAVSSNSDYHGERVAVLPFAIGQFPTTIDVNAGLIHTIPPSGGGATSDLRYVNRHCTGTVVSTKREYYLPYTHVLYGIQPYSWDYPDSWYKAGSPFITGSGHIASNNVGKAVQIGGSDEQNSICKDFQAGAVFMITLNPYGLFGSLAWKRDFMFGIGGVRRALLRVEDGLQPIIINQTQRHAVTWGSVLSGVDLEANGIDPIHKSESQILYVYYTYRFEIF